MKIWVDADASPVAIKEIIFRAANRTKVETTLVANHFLKTPPSLYIKSMQVEKGFDIADNKIVELCESGDLVISNDIPLAAEVIEKGALVLNFRGERLTEDNIKPRLNMRDFMETMRSSGEHTGGPPPLSQADRQNFGNKLDAILAKFS